MRHADPRGLFRAYNASARLALLSCIKRMPHRANHNYDPIDLGIALDLQEGLAILVSYTIYFRAYIPHTACHLTR